MNHDFADVKTVMSETEKVHLGLVFQMAKIELMRQLKKLFQTLY